MPGKSKLTADAAEQAALRGLSKSEHRGEADRARAILLTLEGRRAGEIAAVLGVHVSAVRNWRGYFAHGGAAAAPAARTTGQDRAACRGDRGGDPERRHAPRWRLDAAASVCRDCPARRAGDLAEMAGAPIAPKGFAWRRPRHTLKARQDAAAVAASREHLADLKTQAAAGAIDLVFLDESEALTHPYLARCWPGAAPSSHPSPRSGEKAGDARRL